VAAHLFHVAQQKPRYKIVKNRSRNTQKRLDFDLKFVNFLQRLGALPSDPHSLRQLGALPPDIRPPVIQTFLT